MLSQWQCRKKSTIRAMTPIYKTGPLSETELFDRYSVNTDFRGDQNKSKEMEGNV